MEKLKAMALKDIHIESKNIDRYVHYVLFIYIITYHINTKRLSYDHTGVILTQTL